MQVLAGIIWGAFLSILENIVGRVIIAAGFASVTYFGMESVIDRLLAHGENSLLSLPPDFLALLGLLRIGEVLSISSSALIIKLTYVHGLNNGSIKRYGRR